ncbi:MAG TPA: hypothetical protein VFP39_15695 [Gemmatimonadales bacterium]|nr:hypothetical protein [Gemmatimonadales bacterium]
MRKQIVLGVLTILASPVAAQNFWHPGIGIQGGYARIKAAGTGRSDAIDLIEFPTPGYVAPLLAGSSLFAVIPAGRRLAFEPTLSFANLTESVGGDATTARVGLRADLAFSSSFYGAAGGVMNSLMQGGNHATQFGAQVAAGYRFALTPRLDGRLEAAVTATQKRRPGLGPTDTYALLFGVSSRLDRAAAPRGARAAAPTGAWEPMIGVTGGYSSIHADGTNVTLTGLILPGFGGSLPALSASNSFFPQVPTLFAILPIGRRLAIEPGIDLHRFQGSGQTVFSANLAGRLDYAVVGGWYAALGAHEEWVKATKGSFSDSTKTSVGIPGASVAWGYRFHLAGNFGARTELNYVAFAKNESAKTPAVNTVSILFSLTMPLK